MNDMAETPLFSVVTVCFNAIDTIQDTIDSVASQTGVSFEHIIIDGGSTDGTVDLLKAQESKFKVIVSEPDKGVYDAMQKGLLKAQGTYTGFLNADDYFSGPDSLLKLSQPLSNKDLKFAGLTAALHQIDEQGKVKRLMGKDPFRANEIKWGKFPPHPSTYLETRHMISAGGFDNSFRLLGDFDMFLKVLHQIEPINEAVIGHVSDVIVKMRLGGISTAGVSTYMEIGSEMATALRKNSYRANPIKISLRGFRKLRELTSKV